MNNDEVLTNLSGVFLAIAELYVGFELKDKDTHKMVQWNLAHASVKANPDLKPTHIAKLTGINRNTFTDLLIEPPPQPEENYLSIILNNVIGVIKGDEFSEDTFISEAKKVTKSTASTLPELNQLIEKGCVEILGGGRYKIKSKTLLTSGFSKTYLKIVSKTLLRVVRVMMHNKNAIKGINQLFHENHYSTQIHPKHHKEFVLFIKTTLKECGIKIQDKIEELEDPSINQGAYSEIGVSLFQTFLKK